MSNYCYLILAINVFLHHKVQCVKLSLRVVMQTYNFMWLRVCTLRVWSIWSRMACGISVTPCSHCIHKTAVTVLELFWGDSVNGPVLALEPFCSNGFVCRSKMVLESFSSQCEPNRWSTCSKKISLMTVFCSDDAHKINQWKNKTELVMNEIEPVSCHHSNLFMCIVH